ncbi:Uncharacterised protein [Mycobacterium tuberculosis]|nr:Uncharacterised protein [Mycobacterium tuberculosis]
MRFLVVVYRVVGDEFERKAGRCSRHLGPRAHPGIHLLPELTRGLVGCVISVRQEGVEHQAGTGSKALGSEFEQIAQLLRRPEVRHHLGEHHQLIVLPQVVHGREDVTHDDAHVEGISFGVGANDVGELRGHLHHVDRVSAPCQRQGVTPGSGANFEHPMRRRIGCFVGQRPHTCVWFGTEERRLTGGDPVLVFLRHRPPLGSDLVVQGRAHGGVV